MEPGMGLDMGLGMRLGLELGLELDIGLDGKLMRCGLLGLLACYGA